MPHILVVEDNPGDILLVKESFREIRRNVELSFARDGQEALDFLNQVGQHAHASRPDLILLDLNLPKVSGLDVLSHVKADGALQNIPVLILSTSCTQSDIDRAYSLSANCYLCKPSTLDEFLNLMSSLQDFWLTRAKFSQDGGCLPPEQYQPVQ